MAVAALHLAAGSSSGVLRPRFAAAPTRDPWASEGKLAAEQQALQKWQVRGITCCCAWFQIYVLFKKDEYKTMRLCLALSAVHMYNEMHWPWYCCVVLC
jgi:hypothetical protein